MSSLHTINKSTAHCAMTSCMKALQSGDSILLIEDGVYASAQLSQYNIEGVSIYALREDLLARGLPTTQLPGAIQAVSYCDFVDLVCRHQRCVSWT